MKKLLKDKKNIVIALLGSLFIIMLPQEGLRFFFWIASGVATAVLVDYLINRLAFARILISKSAVITGFIVSGVLDYHQSFHLVVIFSLLAILSKHILKVRKKHIFNPASFALFLAVLCRIPLTWHTEANIYLIVAIGIYLVYSFKKITHILGFLIFFAALFSVDKINPFSILSFFFLFVMLIEPKTSGYGLFRGFVFGSLAGIFSFIIFKFFPGYDFFVGALFLANLCNPLLGRIKVGRG